MDDVALGNTLQEVRRSLLAIFELRDSVATASSPAPEEGVTPRTEEVQEYDRVSGTVWQ